MDWDTSLFLAAVFLFLGAWTLDNTFSAIFFFTLAGLAIVVRLVYGGNEDDRTGR